MFMPFFWGSMEFFLNSVLPLFWHQEEGEQKGGFTFRTTSIEYDFKVGPIFPVNKLWKKMARYQYIPVNSPRTQFAKDCIFMIFHVFSIQSYGSECVTSYSMDWTWFARSPRWFLTWCKGNIFMWINVFWIHERSLFGPWGLVTEMPSWACWT